MQDPTESEKLPKVKRRWKKPLITTIKIAISLGLLYFVLSKIDWALLQKQWLISRKFYLFLAFISFIISQLFSVQRVGIYFKQVGVPLSFITNAKLYALGMFYNFFIPGGVGGDAYKVIALKNHYKKSVRELTSAVFFDRFIGLCAIAILICLGVFLAPIDLPNWIRLLSLSIAVLSTLFGPYILGFIVPRFKSIFLPTLLYSFVIQAFQVGTVLLTLTAIQPHADYYIYALIFLGSSVLSIVSFAGIGIRETVFYYAGEYLNFNPDLSAAIALIFSIITLISSLFGAFYIIQKIDFGEVENK